MIRTLAYVFVLDFAHIRDSLWYNVGTGKQQTRKVQMTKKEFREGNGIVARQVARVVAAALTLTASAAVHNFTNSFGSWSDS